MMKWFLFTTLSTVFLLLDFSAAMADGPGDGSLTSFLTEPQQESQILFEDERFPNVVVANDGSVIATWGKSRFRVRRSEDGGRTWGSVVLVGDGIHAGGAIVNRANGELLLFTHPKHPPVNGDAASRTMFVSSDHGKTWAAQAAEFSKDGQNFLPSLHMCEHGVTLQHGVHAGRLIRPARVYRQSPERYSTAIYSDDNGKSWIPSGPVPIQGSGEGALLELADGRVMYTARRSNFAEGQPFRSERHYAVSRDGGQTWEPPALFKTLPDGPRYRGESKRGSNYNGHFGMMAGFVRLPVQGQDVLLYSNADHDGHERIRLTVWASFDGGQTWPVKRLIDEGPSAYSSLAAGLPGTDSEGWIYLLYEYGEGKQTYVGGRMVRFNLAWLLHGELTGDGKLPSTE